MGSAAAPRSRRGPFEPRNGGGTHRALLRADALRQRHRWRLVLDVERYFYRIDRARLAELLAARLPEAEVRALVARILASAEGLYTGPEAWRWLGWDGPGDPGRGLPIGNLTSQWWGNLYLDALDHHVQRTLRVPGYQRYMDDLFLTSDSRAELEEARAAVAEWLTTERGLELKPDAGPLPTRAPLLYLGHHLGPDGITLGPKARRRLPGRLRRAGEDAGEIEAVLRSYRAALRVPPG